MKKQVGLLLILVSVLAISISAFAHSRKDHDKEIETVFFGGKASVEQKEMSKALEAAAYLTIDQFGGKGQGELDLLKGYVKDLPELNEIDIDNSEISHHREYTHQGWDSKYRNIQSNKTKDIDEKWAKKWECRKRILEDTVEAIFKFNWWSGLPFVGNILQDYGERGDSLCALVYYTHLLGDHEETKVMNQYDYLMPVGGTVNGKNIINEVLYHCEVLFEEQNESREYALFNIKMEEINTKYYKLGKINSDSITTNQKYAEEVLQVMQNYIPEFLEQEEFYQKAVK